MSEQTRPIEQVAEHEVYRNRYVAVFEDEVRFRSGAEGNFLRIVESDGAPGVVALPLCEGRIALVRTYRYALGSYEWSLPRGFAHTADARSSVLEELIEELGAEPTALHSLGRIAPNSGLLASVVEVFVAHYPSTEMTPSDHDEISAVRWVAPADLFTEIREGQIIDAFTLATLCLATTTGTITATR